MTEAEWLVSENSQAMLLVPQLGSDIRKLQRNMRLFTCGCCRLVWELLTDKRSRKAVQKLEAYADDLANERLRRDAYNIANAAYLDVRTGDHNLRWTAACAVVCAAYPNIPPNFFGNLRSALAISPGLDSPAAWHAEANVLRDIFGNPFRPVTFDAAWRTDTVLALARQMYASHEFSAMPILADALQDAGCDNTDVLNHCRGDGPHVRGCWVVDLVLGKE